MPTRAAQIAAIQASIASITAQATSIQSSVNTLSAAQSAGMTITPTTTVSQAAAYVSSGGGGTTTTPTVTTAPTTTAPTTTAATTLTPAQQAQKTAIEKQIAEAQAKIAEAQGKIDTIRQAEAQGLPTGQTYTAAFNYLQGLKDDLKEIPESVTGNEKLDAMYNELKSKFNEMVERFGNVNPNIEITPERAAEFMAQAEQEINPYYQSQLKLAREGFLASIGYTRDEILRFEEDLTKKFQTGHRQLGESMAEQGFALSGLRQRDEREMAEAAQKQAEAARAQAAFQAEQQARQLGAEWGPEAAQPFTFKEMPKFTPSGQVIGGERELPMFELGSAFTGLVGSREFERRGAVQSRQAELETAEKERLLAQEMRKLNL